LADSAETLASRAKQSRIDAAKAKADFLAEVEEALINDTDSATLRRMVEQSVRRNKLDDDPVAGHVQLNMDNASLNTAAAAWGLRRFGDEGAFDPALHTPVGDWPAKGGATELVRPGYVFRDGGEDIQLMRAVVDGRIDATPEPSDDLDKYPGLAAPLGSPERMAAAQARDRDDARAASDRALQRARQESARTEARERFNSSNDPKDNGPKVKALMSGMIDAADLYRKTEAGPSGQRRNTYVGRVRFRDNQHGEFQVVDGEGRNAGWMTRVNRNGEMMYVVHSEDYHGGIHLEGWADSVSLGADVLVNGRHAATGRHDSRRISTGKFEPYVPRTEAQIDREEAAKQADWDARQAARRAEREAREAAQLDKPGHLYGSHPRPHVDMKPSDRDGQRVEIRANKGSEFGTVVGAVGKRTGFLDESFLVVQHDDGTYQTYDSRVVHEAALGGQLDKPGIDSAGFVTSAVNAHSLGRGDRVVVQGVAASIVGTERHNAIVTLTLDDGRVLNFGLNEPVRRVHGGNLRKAAVPDDGPGDADPKAQEPATAPPPAPDTRWPGWMMDMVIASLVAGAILEAMPGLPIGDLISLFKRLAKGWPKDPPSWREMEPQARRGTVERVVWELRQDGWPVRVADVLRDPILQAHLEGHYVGQQVGREVARAVFDGHDMESGPALQLSINWNDWVPGHPEAARLLIEPGGLERLLRESGAVASRLAEGRLDQIGRIIGEGLADGLSPKEIAGRLRALVNDPDWAYMTAVTETNRAMSAASVMQYREAGLLFKGWLTAFDQRVCKICHENERLPDGRPRVVPIDELFPSGDPWPPGHPRCRCAPIPVVSPPMDIGKALTWGQWNLQNPTKLKDAQGQWTGAVPGFDVLDEDEYVNAFGPSFADVQLDSGAPFLLRVGHGDGYAHLVRDLPDAHQPLSGRLDEAALKDLRAALERDPFEGRGRALYPADYELTRAVRLRGGLTLWPNADGGAQLTRTRDSALVANLTAWERMELHGAVHHVIMDVIPDSQGDDFNERLGGHYSEWDDQDDGGYGDDDDEF
jgi:hypothetical protein